MAHATWRTSAPRSHPSPVQTISYALALRLIAIYSRRLDTIHDATADPIIAAAAATLSRGYRTCADLHGTRAALVIATHDPSAEPAGISVTELSRQVTDGGCLVAIVPAARGGDRGRVLAELAAAGLRPVHCIQAITDPGGESGDRFSYHTPDQNLIQPTNLQVDPEAATTCWLVVATAPNLEGGFDV